MTSKQERFAQLYVETGNASEAYRRVYSTKNMKDATINKRASELKLHGEVSGRIKLAALFGTSAAWQSLLLWSHQFVLCVIYFMFVTGILYHLDTSES